MASHFTTLSPAEKETCMRHIRFFATLGLAVPVALLAGGCSTPDTMGGLTDDPIGEAAQLLIDGCYGDSPKPTGFWAGAGNADDVYGALHGTLGSGVTFAAGQVGQAFVFNGANDVQIPDAPALTFPTTLTIEAWINPTNSVTPLQAIVSKNRGAGGTGYAMSISNGRLGFGMNNGSNFSLSSSGTISLNTWTHVAVTRNANVVKLYINGVLDTTSTSAFNGALLDSNRPLTLGSEDTVGGRFFTGLIDEPAVWDDELTASQIAGIAAAGAAGKCHCAEDLCTTGKICSQTPSSYTCDCPAGYFGAQCELTLCTGVTCTALDACHVPGTCDILTGLCSNPAAADGTACSDGDTCTTDSCQDGVCTGEKVSYAGTGPQHWWKADGNTTDSAGSANGTITGGVTYTPAVLNQGFSLNGTNGRVAFNSTGAYPGSGPLTITAWIRTSATGADQAIVSLYDCGGLCLPLLSTAHIDLRVSATGKLVGSIRGTSNVTHTVTGTKTINDGQFHHVAYVRDTSALLLRIFVDGEADGTVAITADNIADTDLEMDPIQVGAKRIAASTASNTFFAGAIDDVRWYQAALTASDMFSLTCEPEDCSPNPCQNGGTCVDGVNSYTCTCATGWTGTNCETMTCPCEALPAWQEVVATNQFDDCFYDPPSYVYLRGVPQYYPPGGGAIRTGMWAETANPDFGTPQQCGAVSVSYGVQTVDNISNAQLAACGDAIVAVGAGMCQ